MIGYHPSNILKYAYPPCGLRVEGSVVPLFGIDGATLSGFTCISVPISSDWWKFGQAKTDSGIKFKLVSYEVEFAFAKVERKIFVILRKSCNRGVAIPRI